MAYIDNATLVIEPHGGYAEQSLYLKYSDHGNFLGYNNVQITHRFELPPGSVINDMWLWIGDSIVKAIILDTWTGRHVYDSIVNLKRDPAYLFKNNNQYELRVFPLTGGSFRKVKINIITPVRFVNNEATVDLPLKMLKADNNTVKQLNLGFRYKDNVWGYPVLAEAPQLEFPTYADTNGYHYRKAVLPDISSFSTLGLKYQINFVEGRYFQSQENFLGKNYFQYSIGLKEAFNLKIDSTGKKVLVALDLSGGYNKNFFELIPNLKATLKSALGKYDFFKLTVAGAGQLKPLLTGWTAATPANIDNILNTLGTSSFGDSIQKTIISRLFYADNNAPLAWGFTGIDSFATVSNFLYLYNASRAFKDADICASYKHCWIDVPVGLQLTGIIDSLNTFFERGGRFVSYFNLDCNDYEKVVTHFIPTLKTKTRDTGNRTLYRNPDGNIGSSFPEYFDHSGNNFLQFSDTTVKVEVRDAQGNPAIVSKRIGNGLLVATGIWLFGDDAATRRLLAIPILGINSSNNRSLMTDLLEVSKQQYTSDPYEKVIFISNSDQLYSRTAAEQLVNSYLSTFSQKPVFTTLNLLNNNTITFPSLTVNGTTYYGSGYLQKYLSDVTFGTHFERQTTEWAVINSFITPYLLPQLSQFSVKAKGDNDSTKISDFIAIKQSVSNANNPLNFVGATTANDSVSLMLTAKFVGNDTIRTVLMSNRILQPEVPNSVSIKRAIVASEKIKTLFQQTVIDTNQIVSLAVRNSVLCDFSAFLALEPNDSVHFIHPFDEWGMLPVEDLPEMTDSLYFNAYPNPFNAQVSFKVAVSARSNVSLKIYNILGELVKTIAENEELTGSKIFHWDASGSSSSIVSSGIYIARIESKELQSSKTTVLSRKIVLMK